MTVFLKLLRMAFLTLSNIILNPIFWIAIFLVYIQYRRINKMRIQILGKNNQSARTMTMRSTIAGIIGGIAGTIVMRFIGITIHIKDFYYVLPLAIVLMLINIRYICFSYSGGLLCLFSLAFGFLHLDVSGMMAIVAVLHLIESILIYFDGYKDALPIFLKDKKYGVIGGFYLQRFWPIPFIVPFPMQMATVVAALGYGDISLGNVPKDKCKVSAKRLLLYSTILLLLSILSTKIYIFKWIAAIFSPVGHEYLIIYGQKEEKRKTPLFRRHSRGVTVLDVNKDGVGERMGIKRGDVIVRMNSYWINHQEELEAILKENPQYIWMQVIDKGGKINTFTYKDYQRGINSLDIVIVPIDIQFVFDIQNTSCILKKITNGIKNKFSKKKNM
ncbi:PDZ domain-containing protein [Crassaminicella indica]|uniref:PDZ domain-containing protein n=1 Tax=Crassaminicella indica TaxID=2855394 RepID=A0ABX8RBQ6_9CLOT|nr:PDZ domain-containing protein [Crassaminicella indica]QXM06492.1 PDZ domain-containing protein [Crassaminicella indica]